MIFSEYVYTKINGYWVKIKAHWFIDEEGNIKKIEL